MSNDSCCGCCCLLVFFIFVVIGILIAFICIVILRYYPEMLNGDASNIEFGIENMIENIENWITQGKEYSENTKEIIEKLK